VVLENYADCPGHELVIPPAVLEQAKTNPELAMLFEGVKTYRDKGKPPSKVVFISVNASTEQVSELNTP
jgi:hypothetical protein